MMPKVNVFVFEFISLKICTVYQNASYTPPVLIYAPLPKTASVSSSEGNSSLKIR